MYTETLITLGNQRNFGNCKWVRYSQNLSRQVSKEINIPPTVRLYKVSQRVHLCEIYENAVILCTRINKVIPNKEVKQPENPYNIVEKCICENVNEQKGCMMGNCLSCSVTNLSLFNFGGSNCESTDSDVSDDVEGINTDGKYYEWRGEDDSHVKKTLVGISKNEALVLLNQQIKLLKKHIYGKRCQVKHYNILKQKILNQTK